MADWEDILDNLPESRLGDAVTPVRESAQRDLPTATALLEHGCVERECPLYDGRVTVPYLEVGSPDAACTVLYMHGLFGSRYEWCRVANRIANSGGGKVYRVLCPDLRGHGGWSGGGASDGSVECSVQQMAADMSAFLKATSRENEPAGGAAVIGFSMGGVVAMYMQAFYASLVKVAVVIGSSVCSNAASKPAAASVSATRSDEGQLNGVADALYEAAMLLPPEAPVNAQVALAIFGMDPSRPNRRMASMLAKYAGLPGGPLTAPGILAGPLTGLPKVTEPMPGFAIILKHPMRASVVQSYLRSITALDLTAHMRTHAKAPCLLIWGEYDFLFDDANRKHTIAAFTEKVKFSHRVQTEFKIYAKGTHFVHTEKQHVDAVIADILEFFKRHGAAASP